ncbi:MAG: hypothetical protein GY792_19735 [Gammaproteobacteria bacterium]|nr:hypothetical protein [Gammaproteobacteria bacterium]
MVSENRREDGFGPSQTTQMRLVPWRDDWNLFKRLFKAAGRLNGIADAIRAGERLAVKDVKNELEKQEGITQAELDRAQLQSPNLAAALMLTLADTVGAQQSICTDELEDSEDGIGAWASLIKHFEHSTGDLRVAYCIQQYAFCTVSVLQNRIYICSMFGLRKEPKE